MGKLIRIYKDNIIINKDYAKKYKEYKKLEMELQPFIKEVKEGLIDNMQKMNKKTVVSNGISASLVNGYSKTSVDSEKLKELDINLYNKCLKTSNVGASIKFLINE